MDLAIVKVGIPTFYKTISWNTSGGYLVTEREFVMTTIWSKP